MLWPPKPFGRIESGKKSMLAQGWRFAFCVSGTLCANSLRVKGVIARGDVIE
jgi:hypothetical protein